MKIASFRIVPVFEPDRDLILSLGPLFVLLKKKYNAQLVNTNLPEDAPPSLPRVVLRLKDTLVGICHDRFDITTVPPSHVAEDMKQCIHFAEQRTFALLEELMKKVHYKWAGVIAEIEYPEEPLRSKSSEESVLSFFDSITRIDRKNRPITSFLLQYGYQENGYYVTYSTSGYERRELRKCGPEQESVVIDPSKDPLVSCGIQVLMDINNKAGAFSSEYLIDIKVLFEQVLSFTTRLPLELNFKEI